MLTDAELEWLERRSNLCTHCGKRDIHCRYGEKYGFIRTDCRYWEPKAYSKKFYLPYVQNDYEDAARFEALVAAYFAEKITRDKQLYKIPFEPVYVTSPKNELKMARIWVEEMMEKEEQRS